MEGLICEITEFPGVTIYIRQAPPQKVPTYSDSQNRNLLLQNARRKTEAGEKIDLNRKTIRVNGFV